MAPGEIAEQLTMIRTRTSAPFVVNLILAFDQRERLPVALDHEVPWISFSWGMAEDLVRRSKDAGSSVLIQVADTREAHAALDAGADALIVQGVEAGGHVQGTQALRQLLPEVRDMTDRPLVAAGGVSSRRAARAAQELGADIVSAGTRFAACRESLAHPRYRAALLAATGSDTVLTDLFDIGWAAPHRILRSDVFRAWECAGRPRPGSRPGEHSSVVTGARGPLPLYSMHPATEGLVGDVDTLPFYAGSDVGSITREETADDVVRDLAAGLT
jgi:NAD(P)H-dependent flavin oxidoreductase YrpB (nitropropane dioxygenase family)